MINYPCKLDPIFDKLKNHNLQPIIVGGFVRDALLEIESKDIDIEIYGTKSYDELEDLLKEFGDVNLVGKSFGVCKLKFDDLDLDFSLPRVDSKIGSGHKGFKVEINPAIDFKTATARRDFTINSIGYNVIQKKILDPFFGAVDLKNRVLRAVDLKSFIEDPLRVLRAAGFCARFDLKIEDNLLKICKDMALKNMLDELPKERIFEEIKKLLLKSPKPSVGFKLLQEFGTKYVTGNFEITDEIAKRLTPDSQTNLNLMFAGLCYGFDEEDIKKFISKLTDEKELLKNVLQLSYAQKNIEFLNIEDINDYILYKLATKVKISEIVILSESLYFAKKRSEAYEIGKEIYKRAKELKILDKKLPALLSGADILKFNLTPSKEFSKILHEAYEAQMHGTFKNRNEALLWLGNYLNS
jgi:tRNA nucleotidyltransferase (CCA-adding enzyme)